MTTRSRIEDVLPAAPLQQGLLFHTMYSEAGPDRYTVQLALDLRGRLDPDRLRAAAAALLRRHPNLRVAFWHEGIDQIVQVVPAEAEPEWHETDLRGRREELPRLSEEDRSRRFDPGTPPLLRFTLVRLADEEHRLLLTHHHLLLDGWSVPLLVRELLALYGDEDSLPTPRPYRDYLAWLTKQDNAAARKAWRTALTGVDGPTLLAEGGNGEPDSDPRRYDTELDTATTEALTRLARQQGVTLGTLLHTAWGMLLGASTDRSDVVFGGVVSGRPTDLAGVESMIGLFVNTVPVRVRLQPGEPISTLLRRVQAEQNTLLEHHHVSLAEIQRDAGAGTLFDTLVVIENYPVDPDSIDTAGAAAGLRLAGITGSDATHYPVTLIVQPGRRLKLGLLYLPDRRTAGQMATLADRLVRLLTRIAAGPDRALAEFDLLSDGERAQLPRTPVAVDRVRTVPERIREHAVRRPDAIAVSDSEQSLTYAELDDRSGRLAAVLVGRGAGRGDFVGVILPRGVNTIVALLAVLRAGAAYVPIDPDYPADRIAGTLDDARPVTVVTDRATEHVLPAGVDRVLVDAGAAARGDVVVDPEEAAYVIYTSGSTGRPKGVIVTHHNVTRLLDTTRELFRFGPEDVWTWFHSTAFDFSVWEIWGALCHGGRLVVVPAEARRSPREMLGLLARERVTVLNQTPSAFAALCRADDEEPEPGLTLRQVIFGGEALDESVLRSWFARHPGTSLVNMYGITETTVHVSHTELRADHPSGIGTALPDLRMYLLDHALRPAPPGVPGEIYVGGPGVARGYLGRSALTATRFVADPFGPPGARLYRSGDRAIARPDGVLDYLGRADRQVKVRGFRIELGEVRAVLAGHAEVAAAEVVARPGPDGTLRLIGYYVPTASAGPDGLHDHLAARLPAHLVPAVLLPVREFPLTRNGKLDVDALPEPSARAGRTPSGPAEELVAAAVAEVLGVSEVGADDDFFALGGHSLSAIRLVSRLRSRLGTDISMRAVFDQPTVSGMAALAAGPARHGPALTPRERPAALPLSFAQQRLWFLDRLHGLGTGYTIPFAARMRGELDEAAFRSALADVVARHEVLRSLFGEDGGLPYQRVLPVATPEVVSTAVTAAEVPERLAEIAAYEFDLSAEIPVRAWVLHLSEVESVVVVLVHHIAADEWSAGPLLGDLATAYGARAAGGPPDWASLPVQYADYALWQRDLLGGEDDPDSPLGTQVGYWRDALDGLPAETTLPLDHARPAVSDNRGDTVDFTLDRDSYLALSEFAAAAGVTVFMVLQAGVAGLLSRLGAGDDVPLGSPVAGRGDAALDELVGFFVNTLVLRTDVSGDPSLRALVARVREANLGAFAHQDVPFERLVELVNPERSLSRHPLFQVMVLYQRRDAGLPGLPGLESEPEPVHRQTAKFDLTFAFAEDPGAGLSGSITYRTDLFQRDTVASAARRLGRLLRGWVADPDTPLGAVEVTDEDEQRALSQWNSTTAPVPSTTLPELFAEQVRRNRDTTALVAGQVRLSYGELDARAERLAGSLRRHGVGPDVVVGVAVPRSIELVLALLAIHRAGGAYLPIDPDHPAARNDYVLRDARPALVLSNEDFTAPVPVHKFTADGVLDAPGKATETAQPRPEHTAYVIYTSGSTGKPKGTVVSHQAIVNRLCWMQDTFGLTAGEPVLQKTPSGFDVSVWEFFWPLITGATLVVAEPGGHRDPAYLAKVIQDERITTVHFVPSMLRAFLAEPAAARCTSVRRVLCSGEALPRELADQALSTMDAELHNLYGPTECAVDVTWTKVESDARPVPIGAPVWNTTCHVLDARLRPVPPGVPGELYLGGVQLARGYLARPALTASRFVAAPGGARLYRTGDRARWTAEGQLEFLGRVDDQVKIRGQRIELGEIESVLTTHPDVTSAATAVWDGRIAAYVVSRPGAEPAEATLLAHAAETLPDHMVPTVVLRLDELPLNPNGKLDRGRLPEPDFGTRTGSQAPRTPRESLFVDLFAELLRLPSAGAEDSFFALGGDSILSLQLVSRARDAGLLVTPRQVFERQTPAGLAEVAEAAASAPAPDPGESFRDLPLTPIMRELLDRGGDLRRFAQHRLLTTPPGLRRDELVHLLSVVRDRHPMLNARLDRAAGRLVLEGGTPAITVTGPRDPDGISRALRDSVAWLDPERGQVLAAVWFDAGAQEPGRLLLVVHHLVVDGVSWRILIDELSRAWHDPHAVAPGGTPMPAWARALATRSGELAGELDQWRRILGGPDPLLGTRALTRDDTMESVSHLVTSVPADVTEQLLITVPSAFHARTDDVLLTALGLALGTWRRAPGALIALEGHGREDHLVPGADLSRTVGWFTSLYPARLDLSGIDLSAAMRGEAAAGQAVKRIKEDLRSLPGNGSAFGVLRYLEESTADVLAQFPEPQIGFNYHGQVGAGRVEDFSVAPESGALVPAVPSGLPAPRVLDLNASVMDGVLRISWSWVRPLLAEDDVREIARLFGDALAALGEHVEGGAGGHTPSDVDLLDLDQAEIDEFEAEWGTR
ncbi:non-ribosomal peptide synthetase [Amycolatopsis jiangsuensis]|uniref:Amino acid adenylation domain-containing protein/non-ribosomal peptide synthase protein (TIGR01720 family) n=1 Tax=Amycolatopsis jiangsuensis TaxID=1181879 RepID=A0A840IXB8_9PSEU|nr:non-ribosomal peptide synthetase [Amycolatopsis jiangsuensis]MBB4685798.1 amino acid adenylation domain-containing protein/non-ribosomal peptide synthase protein (TIGR01720 family) [Amycolatopsis jiangsuensis]